MARKKVKFFHPPHRYRVTTLPCKTNTTANIGANSWTGSLQSQRYGFGRSISIVWGRQVWPSSILERKLTAHTTAISSSRRVCCLTSEHYVIITYGHCSRMERQRTPLGQRWTIRKKEHINFIEPHMWPPNSPDINPVDYAIWDALQQRVYHQRQLKTVEELKRAIVTEWQKLSWPTFWPQ